MIEFGRACRRHRSALLAFVDRSEVGPGTSAALAHLDRCNRCIADIESTVLAITALRRLGDEAGRVEPAADAWPRLRTRIDRWRPARWAIMSPTAGLTMSVAIVTMLIAPLRFGGAASGGSPSAVPPDRAPTSLIERRIEADYISNTRQGSIPAGDTIVRSTGTFLRHYPDDIRPEREEVSADEPSGRPPEAI